MDQDNQHRAHVPIVLQGEPAGPVSGSVVDGVELRGHTVQRYKSGRHKEIVTHFLFRVVRISLTMLIDKGKRTKEAFYLRHCSIN